MHFDGGAVQANRLDSELDDLLLLQPRKDPVEHPRLAPAVHPRINRMPVAQPAGQTTPFATLFGHMQNRIDHLEIAQTDVAPLARKTVFDPAILGFGDFHAPFSTKIKPCQLVLTRPKQIP